MPGPGGFLLADDATQARLAEFDQWVEEQKRQAQQALSSAATTAGNTVTQAAQAVQQAPNAALDQFDQWRQQQTQQALAQQAAQSSTSAQPSTSSIVPAPAAPSTPPTEGSASALGPSPLEQFDQWRQQFDKGRQQLASSAGQAVSTVADQGAKLVDSAVNVAGRNVNAVMGTSQFGDAQLTAAEAYAACGPAAAVRFAEMYGRNPTLREATDLARGVGWNEANGMAGLGSEKLLMDKLGISTKQVGADWGAIANEASTGNPVTISTPGHYFFADGYDPNSGAFHVGRSGLDLKGGSEWMTPAQMEQRMGKLQGALFADNPNVPASSGGGGQTTQTATQTQTTAAGPPSGAIDSSSPEAFARSVAPYAAYAAQALGIDPTWVVAMMGSESNYGKAPGNELFGVKALPGQKGTTLQTHEGEYGGTTQNATFAAYDTPLDSVNAWIDLIKNHYKNAVGATDLGTFVHGLKSGGYFTAAEDEYRNILQGIQNRLAPTVNDALSTAGDAVSAVKATASNAGQQAVDAATNLAQNSQSTLSRAGDLVSSTGQQLQDLRDRGAQGVADLQALLEKQQKDWDTFAQQQQAERDAWRQQMDQQTASIQAGASKAAQTAMDLAGQAPSPFGGTLGSNVEDLTSAPGNLQRLGQGVTAASDEAVRQRQEQNPLSAGLSLGESIAGRQLPEDLRSAVQNAVAPPGAQAPDISGPLSAFLKSSNILPASQTVDLPFLGTTPLADIVGQAANFIIPTGVEERFAGGAVGAAGRAAGRAAVPTQQLRIAAAVGNKAEAARLAVSAAGRWARSSVDDIMSDLAKGPVGDFLTDASGTLDVDKLRAVASSVKEQMTRMYHGTGSDFPSVSPEAVSGEGNLFGPGYYVTSSPEVAGGRVSKGNFAINPETGTTSTYDPATGKFTTYMENVGKLVQPGYAQQRTQFDESSMQDLLGRVMDDMRESRGYFGAGAQEDVRKLLNNEGYRANYTPQDKYEALIAALSRDAPNPQRYLNDLAPDIMAQGGNVRAVDVPQGLKLLNADEPVAPEDLQSVADALTRLTGDANDGRSFAINMRSQNPGGFTGEALFNALRDYVRQYTAEGPGRPGGITNQILADAGFDGITYAGGRRIPMTDAMGNPIEHTANVVFPESLDKVRNAISGRQGGQMDPQLALRLGGAAAGVASQETGPTAMTDQDKSDPWGRFGRDVAAGVLGSAAPGTALALALRAGPSYADIAGLRPGVTHLPGVAQRPAQLFSSYTKQNLLTGPKTQVTNILTQLAELARNPVAAAAGGREDEAIAGLKTAAQALPDAFSNFAKTLTSGQTQMTGGTGATSKFLPAFRMLSATDDFFRTLGWAMGAGMEGQRFLRENPGAVPSAVLSSNRGAIDAAGQKMGSMSVFGEGKGIAGGFSDFKNRLLSSSSGKDQVMGLLWDALVPFSGVPDRIWNIGIKRTPGVGELSALASAGFKFAKGDVRGAQQAVGDALQQSVVSAAILSNVANGNIRGPDDPEHPSGIKLGGQWYDYSSWGPWVLPMAVPASIYESVRKTANKPNAGVAEQIAGAGNSLMKVLANQSYAGDLIKTLSQVGEGNGLGAVGNTALSYTDRLLPAAGALNNAAAIYDPILRDTTRDNPLQTVLARLQSKVPGLEQQLPATPVMTSGKPQERQSSGVGSLVGMQTRPESPLELQIADLERKNYRINDPTKVPTEVSLGGSTIKLTDAEQRAIAEQRGKMIDDALAGQTGSPAWRTMSDEQKALTLNAILSSLDSQNAALFAQMTAPAELQRRIEQGRTVAGKLQPVGSR